jgi:EAL domain-containing protein (putative c-di-GMP-specific phosphodiesterase class I)/ActR/RegA family two-component response regulator
MPLPAAPDYSALRVLVVDDQEHVRRWNQSELKSAGIEHVTLVDGGRGAIAAVTEPGAAFDLIICDLRMPDMDGIEAIRALASLGIEAGVVITSVEDERLIESAGLLATQQGLQLLGQISKPLTADKLAPVLARLTTSRTPAPAATFAISPAELQQAIESREIFLVYQPKIAFRTGAFVGAEALVRWRHPDLGVLEPAAFLRVAESSDELIGALTKSVLEEALDFISRWRQSGHDHTVSVNLPSRAFEVIDLPEELEALTTAHGVDPKHLTIEVSEAQLTVDTVRTRDVVTRLRLKRFGLALDNFGRGASGLHRLHQTPFTELKIDREFVHGCSTSASNRSIVEASLALARSLSVVSVAEGVSDRSEWDLLEELGCDQAQGFFIARPMPANGLEAWAAQWLTRH